MDEELKNEYVKCGLDYIRKYIRMSIQDFDYGNSLVADLEIKKELENFFSKLISVSSKKIDNDKHDISKTFRNLLIPDNFLIFGSEMLLNLSYYQREMVNENYNGKNIIPMIKLRDILLKNPDFYTRLHFTEEILNVFSDQEIIDMTPKLERIFSKADNIGYVGRVRNIVLGAGVELDDKFVDSDFLNALSDEQIKELSVAAKEKIKKVLLNKRKFITIYGDRCRLIKKIRGIEMFDTVMQSVGLRRK